VCAGHGFFCKIVENENIENSSALTIEDYGLSLDALDGGENSTLRAEKLHEEATIFLTI